MGMAERMGWGWERHFTGDILQVRGDWMRMGEGMGETSQVRGDGREISHVRGDGRDIK